MALLGPTNNKSMAVGRSIDDRLGGEISARAGAILDHNLLAETL